jgi:trk system potassium uptake protein TrkA
VIGLNRFGGQVADTLTRLGHEVLAIDENPATVQRWTARLTYVVEADATDEAALRQVGVPDFEWAVVAMGVSVEASVLTVLALAEIGVPEIWARATSDKHAKILSSVGANHVIFPEAAMGNRVAHLITTKMIDFVEFSQGFAVAEIRAPAEAVGRVVGESGLRPKYGVTVVAVRPPDGDFGFATRQTMIPEGSLLVVAGTPEQVQRFAAAT